MSKHIASTDWVEERLVRRGSRLTRWTASEPDARAAEAATRGRAGGDARPPRGGGRASTSPTPTSTRRPRERCVEKLADEG